MSRYLSKNTRKSTRSVPRIEALESRYAPACTTNYNVFLQDLSVTCDSANDFVDVDSAVKSYRLTVNGVEKTYKAVDSISITAGGGNDNVRIMPDSKNLNGVNDPISVNGGAGFDVFSLHDQNSTGAYEHLLTGTTHQRTGTNVVTFDVFENKSLTTGISAANTIRILGSSAATSTFVSTGNSAQDTFYVGSIANSLSTIQGSLILNGGSTEDTLYVTDSGITSPATYTLRNTSVQRSGSAVITFGNIKGVKLYAGSGSDTLNVQGVPVGSHSVWGNGGNDNVVVGSTEGSLDSLDGQVYVYGGTGDDSLQVVDSGNVNASTYEVFGSLLTRSGAGYVHYDSIRTVSLYAGQGDDAILVIETCCVNDTATTTVDAGAGNDVVTVTDAYDTLDSIWGPLNILGGAEANTLNFDDSGSTYGWQFTITSNSVQRDSKGLMSHSAFQTVNLAAGSGDNLFTFAAGGGLAGSLNGGGGQDVLDYSAYNTDLVVNLLTGFATGLGGIADIEHVIAGSGNDILVGDSADNDLLGGAGRDLIIGGSGADTLDGGNGEDLLISGSTDHDGSPDTLNSIRGTWTMSTPYVRRCRQVKAWLNPMTVHGDGATNNLNGLADLDLFYLSTLDTSDWNQGIGEKVVVI